MPGSRTRIGIAIADQLQQLLRHRFMAVGSVAALLRHRALGLAKDGLFPVRDSPIADAKFGAISQTLDDRLPKSAAGRAVAACARVVIAHDCILFLEIGSCAASTRLRIQRSRFGGVSGSLLLTAERRENFAPDRSKQLLHGKAEKS
jgi:hypothetical protein